MKSSFESRLARHQAILTFENARVSAALARVWVWRRVPRWRGCGGECRAGALAAPINLTELGGPAPRGSMCNGGTTAWSNTSASGTAWASFSSCDNWTSTNAVSGFVGQIGATNWWWSLWCQGGCVGTAALYCFEQ